MGSNKPINRRVVQKVFEMSAAGESRSTVGAFFHRSRRQAQHALRNYSSESFSPIFIRLIRLILVCLYSEKFDCVTENRILNEKHRVFNE